jgi:hypothetical protein
MKPIFIKKHFFPFFFDGLTELKIKKRKTRSYSSVKFFNCFYGLDGLTEHIFWGRNNISKFDGSKSIYYFNLRQIRKMPFWAFDGAKPIFDGRKSISYIKLRQIIAKITEKPLKNTFRNGIHPHHAAGTPVPV